MKENHGLYIVATPIGCWDDITLRAIDILKSVDFIAAEDTRHSAKLLEHFNIQTPMISYHDHNEQKSSEILLAHLSNHKSIALITDAGTPLISDPGFEVVRAARKNGYRVIPIPGACALIAGLSVSGLPTHGFIFEGFLPAKSVARKEKLALYLFCEKTVIFYESTHRILDALHDMASVFGDQREIVLARELTKMYETVLAGDASELKQYLLENPEQQKGEFVVLLSPQIRTSALNEYEEHVLRVLLEQFSVKEAVSLAVKITNGNKNAFYEKALLYKKPI